MLMNIRKAIERIYTTQLICARNNIWKHTKSTRAQVHNLYTIICVMCMVLAVARGAKLPSAKMQSLHLTVYNNQSAHL